MGLARQGLVGYQPPPLTPTKGMRGGGWSSTPHMPSLSQPEYFAWMGAMDPINQLQGQPPPGGYKRHVQFEWHMVCDVMM